MLKARFFMPVLLGAALLSACAPADRSSLVIDRDAAKGYERQLQPNFDMTSVLVVRFDLDGQTLEALSLFPLSLPSSVTPETGKARTWFWFDADRTVLRVMTTPNEGAISFLEVPVADLKPGLSLEIPVIQADGSARTSTITITELLKKP